MNFQVAETLQAAALGAPGDTYADVFIFILASGELS